MRMEGFPTLAVMKQSRATSRHPPSCSATEGILPVVDGVSELLQHDVQGWVLRKFDHEHARFHTDVPRVRRTWGERSAKSLNAPAAFCLVPQKHPSLCLMLTNIKRTRFSLTDPLEAEGVLYFHTVLRLIFWRFYHFKCIQDKYLPSRD